MPVLGLASYSMGLKKRFIWPKLHTFDNYNLASWQISAGAYRAEASRAE
jgi:hypothetical protein